MRTLISNYLEGEKGVWEISSHAVHDVTSRALTGRRGGWFPTINFALICLPSVHMTWHHALHAMRTPRSPSPPLGNHWSMYAYIHGLRSKVWRVASFPGPIHVWGEPGNEATWRVQAKVQFPVLFMSEKRKKKFIILNSFYTFFRKGKGESVILNSFCVFLR